MKDRARAIADIEQAKKELFAVGRPDLNENEERYFNYLMDAEHELKAGANLSPLFMLELFLFAQGNGNTTPGFVIQWLYNGAITFHQAEGQEPFERGLGFTAGRGKHSGQGHEFKKARREQVLTRYEMFTRIRMLNIFEGKTVDRAVGIIHEIHTQQMSSSLRKKKPLSESELHAEYRAWKGKNWSTDEETLYREAWRKYRKEWKSIIEDIETEI